MNQLKACPFCGSNDIEVKQYYNDGWYWFVTCKNCKAEKIHQFKGVAIQEWNTRPAEDALKAEVERLKANVALLGGEYRKQTELINVLQRALASCNQFAESIHSFRKLPCIYQRASYIHEICNQALNFGTDNNAPTNDTDNNLRERM